MPRDGEGYDAVMIFIVWLLSGSAFIGMATAYGCRGRKASVSYLTIMTMLGFLTAVLSIVIWQRYGALEADIGK